VRDRHGVYSDELRRRVLDGPGTLNVALRQSLASGEGVPEDLASFADMVREQAYNVGDEMLETLTTAGYSGDAVYEATLSVALGAGAHRLDAGIRALAESFASTPVVSVTVAAVEEAEPVEVDDPIGPITVVSDGSAPPLARRNPGENIPEQLR
jgi:hypothetical protein